MEREEAIKIVKSHYPANKQMLNEALEFLIPELKESDDERIRKDIMILVKDWWDRVNKDDISTKEQMIAWLEKQKATDKEIVFRPLAGTDIIVAAKQALEKIEIGKEIILAFNGAYIPVNGKTVAEICNEYFAWTEKQNKNNSENYCEDCINRKGCINCENGDMKETEHKVEPKFKVGDIIINIHYRWDGKHRIREITDGKYIFDSGSYIDIKEQNSWELADKVEPKFHEGDLIIDKQGIVHQIEKVIENVTNNTFAYDLVGGGYFNEEVKSCRLWTIEDAKDGDVLYSLDSKQPFIFKHRKPNEQAEAYCGLNIYGKFFVWGTKDCVITLSNYIPATKEQRDTLFKKMKEAGYQWNPDTKELKKVEQKPTWSEDDERIVTALMEGFRYHQLFNPRFGEVPNAEIISWIKSLKERLS